MRDLKNVTILCEVNVRVIVNYENVINKTELESISPIRGPDTVDEALNDEFPWLAWNSHC